MNVLITPENCEGLLPIKLPGPKDGKLEQYFYDEVNLALYETIRYHDKFRSWLLDDKFCKEGHMNLMTRIDPLYIFLPIIQKYASKQFRTLDDICETFATSCNESSGDKIQIEQALSPEIKWDSICEIKQVDDEQYLRYSETNTLDWLEKKHARTMNALNGMIDGESSKATLLSYASDLIDVYLPEFISEKFKSRARSNPIPIPSTNRTKIALINRSDDKVETIERSLSNSTNGRERLSLEAPKKKPADVKGQKSIMSFFQKKN